MKTPIISKAVIMRLIITALFFSAKAYSQELTRTFCGRVLVLDIALEEQVYTINDVTVRHDIRKDQAINEMPVISARTFTIDETGRYAGNLGDPSRMAANYAGVTSVSDQRNDMVIRGNSPHGLIWRFEGIGILHRSSFKIKT